MTDKLYYAWLPGPWLVRRRTLTLIDGGPACSRVIEVECERCARRVVYDAIGRDANERAAVVEDARAHWEAHARGEYPLTFYALPGVDDMKVTRFGTWTDVVLAVPYFVSPANGPPPPRRVVNSVLREGVAFAGMSGGAEWPRHELDADEYEELRTDLVARGHPDIAPPAWVDSTVAYRDWVVSLLWGCSPRARPGLARGGPSAQRPDERGAPPGRSGRDRRDRWDPRQAPREAWGLGARLRLLRRTATSASGRLPV